MHRSTLSLNRPPAEPTSPTIPDPLTPARDTVFLEQKKCPTDFQFDEKVVSVFDDMVERSVPFYAEIQRMIVELADDFAVDGTNIYDLGCATGTTLAGLSESVHREATLVGVDNSKEMLARCREKVSSRRTSTKVELLEADLNQGCSLHNASVVVMVLTLQFVRPLYREALMRSIHQGLNPRGCLIIVEKLVGEDPEISRHFIEYYHRLKRRRGYSDLEIAQKREALENVLIPYRLMENRDLILNAGFRSWDIFFKWYNFCGLIAIK